MQANATKFPTLPLSRVYGLVALVVLVVCGCNNSPPTVTLTTDDVILCFGDSLTKGVGASHNSSYPSVLAELTGTTVINSGKPGETSGEGLQRLPTVLAEENPSIVILCHGGNDILQRLNYDQTKANLKAMVSLCLDKDIQVVLIAVPSVLSDAHPLYSDVAEEMNIPIEKSTLGKLIKEDAYKSDNVHLNAAGYKKLAEAVFNILRDNNGSK